MKKLSLAQLCRGEKDGTSVIAHFCPIHGKMFFSEGVGGFFELNVDEICDQVVMDKIL